MHQLLKTSFQWQRIKRIPFRKRMLHEKRQVHPAYRDSRNSRSLHLKRKEDERKLCDDKRYTRYLIGIPPNEDGLRCFSRLKHYSPHPLLCPV
ncbi:hypothetical protein NPIL_237691 [Nephila pilipes]|uniref:Uncharacterized protein n=1 Tax=Nephila pilipes TaxID=299642 RepID=A0A8X6NGF8_NEPPI|nr:hypothetical protein NPIL_237691 [Nephila pilipes]